MENKKDKSRFGFFPKMVSLSVAAMIAASPVMAADPARLGEQPFVWDGYAEEAQSEMISLLDFNSFSEILDAGGLPTASYLSDGKTYSANWTNHTVNKDFWFKLKETDWTKTNSFNMKIYSQKATGATITLIIYSPSATSAQGNYFRHNFTVDWEGWKTISLKTTMDFSKANNPIWTNVTELRLVGHGGWSVQGNPETNLYISDIYLDKSLPKDSFEFYGEDKVKETLESLKDSFAVYAGGSNMTTSDGAKPLGCEAGFVNGEVMIPLEAFKTAFGAEVSKSPKEFTVTLGNNKISGAVGSNTVSVNGNNVVIDTPAYSENNNIMVPGAAFGEFLGKCAGTDGRFLVVGTDIAKQKMHRVEGLGVNEYSEIASYIAYRKNININDIDDSKVKVVKDNWKRYIVGDETSNDMTDPDIRERVEQITDSGESSWKIMIKDPDSTELFSDIKTTTSQDMADTYHHLHNMAKAWAIPGGELKGNEELKNDILYGIKWMHQNRFGNVNNTGWKPSGFDNWADWRVEAPKFITEILLLMEEEFKASEIKTYLKYFDDNNHLPEYTGGNFLAHAEVIMLSSILQKDYARVLASLALMEKMYLYVDDNERITESQLRDEARKAITPMKGAGFFTDGSYILHTLHAMNGSYGASHITHLRTFEKYFAKTVFELNAPFRYNTPQFFENAISTIIYGTTMYRHMMGRTDNPNNYTAGVASMASAFSLSSLYSDTEREMMLTIVKTALKANPGAEKSIINNLPIDDIKAFKEFLKDDSIKPLEDVSSNKVFYNLDKVVHKTNDWSVGISMSSSRVFNYECINENNKTGWYLGDGRTEYYLWGSNLNATTAYWASMDPYRLPGTTVDTQERKAVSVLQGNEYLSSKDFVGGVTSGKYGTAAMHLESYHNDTDFGASSGGGGPNPAHKSDLVAKKAYFMFDDELVCLGNSVNAKANNDAEVLTVVDNLLNDKSVSVTEPITLEAYKIKSAVASETPEAENIAPNTIDDSLETKWAGQNLAELVWDIGEEKELGFITLSFINGSKRQQKFELHVSKDGETWTSVFDGASSGKKENNESFDLKNSSARYVKFINKGNSAGSAWVSVADCKIYPPSPDGAIGFPDVESYGSDVVTSPNGEMNVLGEDVALSGTPWLNIAGKCGYVFPTENTQNMGELKIRRTNSAQSHTELWFSHGINPTDGSYAYILLPGKDSEFTKNYSENRKTKILSNNGTVQAVKDEELGMTGIVFWESASFDKITTDSPCIVMYTETETEFKISVCDPTQKLKNGVLTVPMTLKLTDCDEMISCSYDSGNTTININYDGSCGRSMQAVFSK